LITAWLFAAALAQLMFLAHWPMHVFGQVVGWEPGVVVALVRMGVYGGLAWGMLHHRREAWAATVLELLRSLICFMTPLLLGDRSLTAAAYPTAWAQGLLTAVLPLLLPLDVAVAGGWRPPYWYEDVLNMALRMWGATSVFAALWLRHRGAAFGAPPQREWVTIFREGLPPVLLVAAVEGVTLYWSLAVMHLPAR
jgi:hypothetical protein